MTCYSWAPSSGDHLFSCSAISRPPHISSNNDHHTPQFNIRLWYGASNQAIAHDITRPLHTTELSRLRQKEILQSNSTIKSSSLLQAFLESADWTVLGLRSSCKNELAPAPELCFFITWHRLCFVNTL